MANFTVSPRRQHRYAIEPPAGWVPDEWRNAEDVSNDLVLRVRDEGDRVRPAEIASKVVCVEPMVTIVRTKARTFDCDQAFDVRQPGPAKSQDWLGQRLSK
ncbi:MAG TPA: hypothetical protein VGQ77_04825 [Methylomirabilota bacterium]|nr:hypothetical protein [Methylomirabilota bacterium]